MTSWHGHTDCITGLCGESTGYQWIPFQKASNAEIWWGFLLIAGTNCRTNSPIAGDWDQMIMQRHSNRIISTPNPICANVKTQTECIYINAATQWPDQLWQALRTSTHYGLSKNDRYFAWTRLFNSFPWLWLSNFYSNFTEVCPIDYESTLV